MRYLMLALGLITCLAFVGCGGKSGGGAMGGGTPAGHYAIDKAQFKELVTTGILKDMGVKEIPAPVAARIDELLKSARIDLDVRPDATWTIGGSIGGKPIDESGTWTLAGDQITMKTTKKDGKDSDESKTGTYKDGVIMVKPDDDAPGEMRLVRQ